MRALLTGDTHINEAPATDVQAGQLTEARVCPVPRQWSPGAGGSGGGRGDWCLLLLLLRHGGVRGGECLVWAADVRNVEAELRVNTTEVDLLHDEGHRRGERLYEVVYHESEGRTLVVGHTRGRAPVLHGAGPRPTEGVQAEVGPGRVWTAAHDLTSLEATEECLPDQQSHVLSVGTEFLFLEQISIYQQGEASGDC